MNSFGIFSRLKINNTQRIMKTLEKIPLKPNWISVRDSLHDPRSWYALFELYQSMRDATSCEILTYMPLVYKNVTNSYSSGCY